MIDNDVLRPRIPRLGTVTCGRGVEATSRQGKPYSRPTRSETLVFHTDDPEVANAVQVKFGGDIVSDSLTWEYDVVSEVRSAEVLTIPAGFRQALELWRAAECIRRCDGVTMSTLNGRPTDRPCLCAEEMAKGAERSCRPHSTMPILIELDVERFGIWELRSNAWGTAASLKGVVAALTMVGASQAAVPARLTMVDRTVRDGRGKVHEVTEFQLAIANSQASLEALAARSGEALGTPALAQLGTGDEQERLALLERWANMQVDAHRLGLREFLVGEWRSRFPGRSEVEALELEDLHAWLDLVASTIAEAETQLRGEGEPS